MAADFDVLIEACTARTADAAKIDSCLAVIRSVPGSGI